MNNPKMKQSRRLLQIIAAMACLYGLVSAGLELWNLNIIPGRVGSGVWLSLVMIAAWAAFIWRDRSAPESLRRSMLNGAMILIVILLAAYASMDKSSLPARLSNLAMNWSFAGLALALFLRVRDEERKT